MSKLTLSAEDSPAKTSVSQGEEQDLKEQEVASGMNSTGSSKKSGRATRSSKMSQPFALEDWTKFSGHSLRSGMMQSGIVYPLPPLVPLTKGTGSGFWRTPNAREKGGGEYKDPEKILKRWQAGHQINLSEQVKLWPTPTVCRGSMFFENNWMERNSVSLASAVYLYPTPTTDGLNGGSSGRKTAKAMGIQVSKENGQLNPTWVEWLMGFPTGWTDLSNSETP